MGTKSLGEVSLKRLVCEKRNDERAGKDWPLNLVMSKNAFQRLLSSGLVRFVDVLAKS